MAVKARVTGCQIVVADPAYSKLGCSIHDSPRNIDGVQADDRLLMVSEATSSSPSSFDPIEAQQRAESHLAVQYIKLPQQYISPRYPLLHAAISQDGMDIAVAGTRGLGLYSRRSCRWRLFGDISQEREVIVQASITASILYGNCCLLAKHEHWSKQESASDRAWSLALLTEQSCFQSCNFLDLHPRRVAHNYRCACHDACM